MDNTRRNQFLADVRYNEPVNNVRYNNQTKVRTQENQKRTIKAAKTINNRFKGIAISAISLLVATGIAVPAFQYNELKQLYSKDIQDNIKVESLEQLNQPFETTWDGQNFNVSLECNRPELYNTLQSSNLDEMLNKYITASKEDKELLYSNLANSADEIIEFNMQLIKASLADSLKTEIDNIRIDTTFKNSYSNAYSGHTLHINGLEAFQDSRLGTYNYNEIPKELFSLISDARLQQEMPSTNYLSKETKSSDEKLEDAVDVYKRLKLILNEHDLTIKNNKLCVQEVSKGTYHEYSEGFILPEFEEIKDDGGRD